MNVLRDKVTVVGNWLCDLSREEKPFIEHGDVTVVFDCYDEQTSDYIQDVYTGVEITSRQDDDVLYQLRTQIEQHLRLKQV